MNSMTVKFDGKTAVFYVEAENIKVVNAKGTTNHRAKRRAKRVYENPSLDSRPITSNDYGKLLNEFLAKRLMVADRETFTSTKDISEAFSNYIGKKVHTITVGKLLVKVAGFKRCNKTLLPDKDGKFCVGYRGVTLA